MKLEELTYKLFNIPTPDVRELLERTVYGTKGGMQISHCDTSWKLDLLISPDFHCLYDGDILVGVVVYSNRRSWFGSKELNTLYIRYFSVNPNYQNKGVAQYITKIAVTRYKEILSEPTVVYAFIEAKNTRSMAVGDHFEPLSLGTFSPIYISRFYPKQRHDVDSSQEAFERILSVQELGNFSYDRSANSKVRHFTIHDGETYASIRCYPVKWEVIHYPNNNWMMMKVLPRIPMLGKLTEGRMLNFVAVDTLAWNNTDLLIKLCEHALAELKVSKLMIFADNSDAKFDDLRKSSRKGLMSKLQHPPKVGIQVFFHDCSEEFINSLEKKAVEIRGFDVT